MEETPLEATQKYVNGIQWPASKEEVLQAVESNGAPDDVLKVIREMDTDRFTGPNDVHNALWMDA
jgi:hypothetical protein